MPNVTVRPSTGTDDGYFYSASAVEIYSNSSDPLGFFSGYSNWFLVDALDIPQGSVILSATFHFYLESGSSSSIYQFSANNVDDASHPTTAAAGRALARTAEIQKTLDFSSTGWKSVTGLAPAVQTVVNRAGWVANNSFMLIARHQSGSGSGDMSPYEAGADLWYLEIVWAPPGQNAARCYLSIPTNWQVNDPSAPICYLPAIQRGGREVMNYGRYRSPYWNLKRSDDAVTWANNFGLGAVRISSGVAGNISTTGTTTTSTGDARIGLLISSLVVPRVFADGSRTGWKVYYSSSNQYGPFRTSGQPQRISMSNIGIDFSQSVQDTPIHLIFIVDNAQTGSTDSRYYLVGKNLLTGEVVFASGSGTITGSYAINAVAIGNSVTSSTAQDNWDTMTLFATTEPNGLKDALIKIHDPFFYLRPRPRVLARVQSNVTVDEDLVDGLTFSDSKSGLLLLTNNLTDSVSLADITNAILSGFESVEDTVILSDTKNTISTLTGIVSDSIVGSETVTGQLTTTSVTNDSATLSDIKSGLLTQTNQISDTVELSDSKSGQLTVNAELSDTVDLSDTETQQLTVTLETDDSVTISDDLPTTCIFVGNVFDECVLSDTQTNTMVVTQSVTDTVELSDTHVGTVVTTSITTDSLTLSDTTVGGYLVTESIFEEVIISETVIGSLVVTNTTTDTVVVSDEETNNYTTTQSLTDSIELSDTQIGLLTVTLTTNNSVTLSDSQVGLLTQTNTTSDSVTLSDSKSASQLISLQTEDNFVVSDSVTQSLTLLQTTNDSVVVSDDITDTLVGVGRISDQVVAVETLQTLIIFKATTTDSIVVSDESTGLLVVLQQLTDTVVFEDISQSVSSKLPSPFYLISKSQVDVKIDNNNLDLKIVQNDLKVKIEDNHLEIVLINEDEVCEFS